MIDLNLKEVKLALDAVRQASQLVQQVQSELVSASLTKDDRSPVTVADFASQAVVAKMLDDVFPGDPLVAEEDSAALREAQEEATLEKVTSFVARVHASTTPASVCDWIDRGKGQPSQRFWTLDPIDGTKGFLRSDQYAVALALLIDGKVQLGVLGCPKLDSGYRPAMTGEGCLVLARRSQGSWTTSLSEPGRFEALHVSACNDPGQARMLRSFESGHTNVNQIDEFARSLGVQVEPVRMDSQAKYAVLASGHGELLIRLISPSQPDYHEKIWDQAAGSLVLEEAGGQISDLAGKPLDFRSGRTLANNRGVLASNHRLHPAALKTLVAIGA